MYDDGDVSILKGKILINIEKEMNCDDIVGLIFTTIKGEKYKLYHNQDCCEYVYLEDICGDLDDLIGMPLLQAEETNCKVEGNDDYHRTWTFYKFATIIGSVTLRWLGESNGYYSEHVDFERMI